jgi:branched-chain amino acid transport system substrate-binding protein
MASSAVPSFTAKGNKLVVRLMQSTTDSVPNLVSSSIKYYTAKNMKAKSAVVMAVSDSDLGNQWAGAFKSVWATAGREVVGVIPVAGSATDFSAQVGAALNKKPDVIALTTNCAPTAILVNQFVEQGFKGSFIFGTPCTDLASLAPLVKKPDALNNATFDISAWALSSPSVDRIKQDFQKRFGFPAEWTAGLAYDGVNLLVKSMQIAGTTTDVNKIRAAMPKAAKDMGTQSVMGYTGITDVGNMEMHSPVGVYQNGKMVATSAGR